MVTSMDVSARAIDIEIVGTGFDDALDLGLEVHWMDGAEGPAIDFEGEETSSTSGLAVSPEGARLLAVTFRRVDPTRGPIASLSVEIPPASVPPTLRMAEGTRQELPEFGEEPTAIELVAGGLSFRLELAKAAPLPPPAMELAMAAPWPSPFRYLLQVPLTLPEARRVLVEVFDVGGRRVRRLHDGELPPGEHLFAWDVRTDTGRRVGDGVYFVRVTAGQAVTRHRVIRMGPR